MDTITSSNGNACLAVKCDVSRPDRIWRFTVRWALSCEITDLEPRSVTLGRNAQEHYCLTERHYKEEFCWCEYAKKRFVGANTRKKGIVGVSL
jgi:hypothetical protein